LSSIQDIRDYNKLGDMKKELSNTAKQVYPMNQLSARQNKAVSVPLSRANNDPIAHSNASCWLWPARILVSTLKSSLVSTLEFASVLEV
jgi:hypothetical protein